MEPSPLTGVVLAGGASSRFGGAPKGLARVGGRRLVDRVAASLGSVCERLLLVANAPDADTWLPGVPVVPDVLPGRGALGGLHAALAHAGTSILVVAWDMPFITPALLRELRDALRDGVDAAVPIGPAGPEPLCACYGSACLAAAECLLDSDERRARALAESVATVYVERARIAALGDPTTLLLSVNTPADLERAEALARAPGEGV